MRPRLPPLAIPVALVLGCGSPDPGQLVSEIEPGLRVRGSAALSPDDHLVEMLVHEDHLYVANSWFGVGVLRLEDDGGLTITDHGEEIYGELRCTSLALHPSSDTLYCAGDTPNDVEPRTPAVERFDLSSPGQPAQLEPFALEHWSVRDIEVFEDTLLIHHFDDGLWTAQIGPTGELSTLQRVDVEGNARTSVAVGERVVTAFADPEGQGSQLRLFDPSGWTELARLPLAGPPLGISAEAEGGSRVAVGLGSGGMALVEVGADSLTLSRTLTPPAVVTHGLVAGELAFAITLSGAFAWTLDGDEPRLFGFGAEGTQGEKRTGNMLHGLLHEGELLTSDWTWIERWAIEPAGEAVALDVPRGVYVPTEGPIRWQLRNVGPVPLRAEFWYRRQHLFDVEVAGESLTEVELPAALREELASAGPIVQLGIRVHDPAVASEGQPLSTSAFVIVQRHPGDPLPPALGDVFPQITLADAEQQPFSLPLAEGTQTIWFTLDCALMWPEVEDLAWLARSGRDLGRGTPVVISDTDLQLDGFARRWSIDNLRLGLWGPAAPPEVAAANAEFGEDLYHSFAVYDLPADAVVMDYVIDAEGRVESLERMYRGPWSLALPWPWE